MVCKDKLYTKIHSFSCNNIVIIFASIILISGLICERAEAIVIRHDVKASEYEVDSSAFPFIFSIYKDENGYNNCLATLIASQWAITAEHCTKDKPFLSGVKKGYYRVKILNDEYNVDGVVRNGGNADLALLHLATSVSKVKPLPIYRRKDEVGKIVFLAGWGGIGNGVDGLSPTQGSFRVAENAVAAVQDNWIILRFDDPRSAIDKVLALEGISGPGDSGGPALIMTNRGWAVAGISSSQVTFARPEGLYGAEEYYGRISTYSDWIDKTILYYEQSE